MQNPVSGKLDLQSLSKTALSIRRDSISMLGIALSGHPGGSLSVTDILTILYFRWMKHDPKNPKWADRDRLILSKGHGCPALYAALVYAGYFDREMLWSLRKLGSPLQGHPDMRRLPGLEASTGSLGQGLSIGIGMALAARFDKKDFRTYVVMSDGEMNEGQTWEAAAFASFRKLSNLILIVDMNKYQLSGTTKEILDMEPMTDKWRAFGWNVKEVDGHSLEALDAAVAWAHGQQNGPSVILAHTVKGKGVTFMENNNNFHGVAPTKAETEKALRELGENEAQIQKILGMIK
jgi:transketolase